MQTIFENQFICTKEYYNEESFVTYENNEYVFKNIPN